MASHILLISPVTCPTSKRNLTKVDGLNTELAIRHSCRHAFPAAVVVHVSNAILKGVAKLAKEATKTCTQRIHTAQS